MPRQAVRYRTPLWCPNIVCVILLAAVCTAAADEELSAELEEAINEAVHVREWAEPAAATDATKVQNAVTPKSSQAGNNVVQKSQSSEAAVAAEKTKKSTKAHKHVLHRKKSVKRKEKSSAASAHGEQKATMDKEALVKKELSPKTAAKPASRLQESQQNEHSSPKVEEKQTAEGTSDESAGRGKGRRHGNKKKLAEEQRPVAIVSTAEQNLVKLLQDEASAGEDVSKPAPAAKGTTTSWQTKVEETQNVAKPGGPGKKGSLKHRRHRSSSHHTSRLVAVPAADSAWIPWESQDKADHTVDRQEKEQQHRESTDYVPLALVNDLESKLKKAQQRRTHNGQSKTEQSSSTGSTIGLGKRRHRRKKTKSGAAKAVAHKRMPIAQSELQNTEEKSTVGAVQISDASDARLPTEHDAKYTKTFAHTSPAAAVSSKQRTVSSTKKAGSSLVKALHDAMKSAPAAKGVPVAAPRSSSRPGAVTSTDAAASPVLPSAKDSARDSSEESATDPVAALNAAFGPIGKTADDPSAAFTSVLASKAKTDPSAALTSAFAFNEKTTADHAAALASAISSYEQVADDPAAALALAASEANASSSVEKKSAGTTMNDDEQLPGPRVRVQSEEEPEPVGRKGSFDKQDPRDRQSSDVEGAKQARRPESHATDQDPQLQHPRLQNETQQFDHDTMQEQVNVSAQDTAADPVAALNAAFDTSAKTGASDGVPSSATADSLDPSAALAAEPSQASLSSESGRPGESVAQVEQEDTTLDPSAALNAAFDVSPDASSSDAGVPSSEAVDAMDHSAALAATPLPRNFTSDSNSPDESIAQVEQEETAFDPAVALNLGLGGGANASTSLAGAPAAETVDAVDSDAASVTASSSANSRDVADSARESVARVEQERTAFDPAAALNAALESIRETASRPFDVSSLTATRAVDAAAALTPAAPLQENSSSRLDAVKAPSGSSANTAAQSAGTPVFPTTDTTDPAAALTTAWPSAALSSGSAAPGGSVAQRLVEKLSKPPTVEEEPAFSAVELDPAAALTMDNPADALKMGATITPSKSERSAAPALDPAAALMIELADVSPSSAPSTARQADSQAGCQWWCHDHTAAWTAKCAYNWGKCSGCSVCASEASSKAANSSGIGALKLVRKTTLAKASGSSTAAASQVPQATVASTGMVDRALKKMEVAQQKVQDFHDKAAAALEKMEEASKVSPTVTSSPQALNAAQALLDSFAPDSEKALVTADGASATNVETQQAELDPAAALASTAFVPSTKLASPTIVGSGDPSVEPSETISDPSAVLSSTMSSGSLDPSAVLSSVMPSQIQDPSAALSSAPILSSKDLSAALSAAVPAQIEDPSAVLSSQMPVQSDDPSAALSSAISVQSEESSAELSPVQGDDPSAALASATTEQGDESTAELSSEASAQADDPAAALASVTSEQGEESTAEDSSEASAQGDDPAAALSSATSEAGAEESAEDSSEASVQGGDPSAALSSVMSVQGGDPSAALSIAMATQGSDSSAAFAAPAHVSKEQSATMHGIAEEETLGNAKGNLDPSAALSESSVQASPADVISKATSNPAPTLPAAMPSAAGDPAAELAAALGELQKLSGASPTLEVKSSMNSNMETVAPSAAFSESSVLAGNAPSEALSQAPTNPSATLAAAAPTTVSDPGAELAAALGELRSLSGAKPKGEIEEDTESKKEVAAPLTAFSESWVPASSAPSEALSQAATNPSAALAAAAPSTDSDPAAELAAALGELQGLSGAKFQGKVTEDAGSKKEVAAPLTSFSESPVLASSAPSEALSQAVTNPSAALAAAAPSIDSDPAAELAAALGELQGLSSAKLQGKVTEDAGSKKDVIDPSMALSASSAPTGVALSGAPSQATTSPTAAFSAAAPPAASDPAAALTISFGELHSLSGARFPGGKMENADSKKDVAAPSTAVSKSSAPAANAPSVALTQATTKPCTPSTASDPAAELQAALGELQRLSGVSPQGETQNTPSCNEANTAPSQDSAGPATLVTSDASAELSEEASDASAVLTAEMQGQSNDPSATLSAAGGAGLSNDPSAALAVEEVEQKSAETSQGEEEKVEDEQEEQEEGQEEEEEQEEQEEESQTVEQASDEASEATEESTAQADSDPSAALSQGSDDPSAVQAGSATQTDSEPSAALSLASESPSAALTAMMHGGNSDPSAFLASTSPATALSESTIPANTDPLTALTQEIESPSAALTATMPGRSNDPSAALASAAPAAAFSESTAQANSDPSAALSQASESPSAALTAMMPGRSSDPSAALASAVPVGAQSESMVQANSDPSAALSQASEAVSASAAVMPGQSQNPSAVLASPVSELQQQGGEQPVAMKQDAGAQVVQATVQATVDKTVSSPNKAGRVELPDLGGLWPKAPGARPSLLTSDVDILTASNDPSAWLSSMMTRRSGDPSALEQQEAPAANNRLRRARRTDEKVVTAEAEDELPEQEASAIGMIMRWLIVALGIVAVGVCCTYRGKTENFPEALSYKFKFPKFPPPRFKAEVDEETLNQALHPAPARSSRASFPSAKPRMTGFLPAPTLDTDASSQRQSANQRGRLSSPGALVQIPAPAPAETPMQAPPQQNHQPVQEQVAQQLQRQDQTHSSPQASVAAVPQPFGAAPKVTAHAVGSPETGSIVEATGGQPLAQPFPAAPRPAGQAFGAPEAESIVIETTGQAGPAPEAGPIFIAAPASGASESAEANPCV